MQHPSDVPSHDHNPYASPQVGEFTKRRVGRLVLEVAGLFGCIVFGGLGLFFEYGSLTCVLEGAIGLGVGLQIPGLAFLGFAVLCVFKRATGGLVFLVVVVIMTPVVVTTILFWPGG